MLDKMKAMEYAKNKDRKYLFENRDNDNRFFGARFDIAYEQASKLSPSPIKNVIKYTNDFLRILGMAEIVNPRFNISEDMLDEEMALKPYCYNEIRSRFSLDNKWNENDLIWMKFTTDGYLAVVAKGNDIGFNRPKKTAYSDEEYKLGYKAREFYMTGIITHRLKKVQDESFVFVFPIYNIPEELELSVGDIECGIGNYLIAKKVPILDYFSHRF